MRIAQEEIFGPVLAILPYDTVDEAVELANATIYGLNAMVWGTIRKKAVAVARRIRSGNVYVNDGPRDVAAPFGGYGASGIGREGGVYDLMEFTQLKAVFDRTTFLVIGGVGRLPDARSQDSLLRRRSRLKGPRRLVKERPARHHRLAVPAEDDAERAVELLPAHPLALKHREARIDDVDEDHRTLGGHEPQHAPDVLREHLLTPDRQPQDERVQGRVIKALPRDLPCGEDEPGRGFRKRRKPLHQRLALAVPEARGEHEEIGRLAFERAGEEHLMVPARRENENPAARASELADALEEPAVSLRIRGEKVEELSVRGGLRLHARQGFGAQHVEVDRISGRGLHARGHRPDQHPDAALEAVLAPQRRREAEHEARGREREDVPEGAASGMVALVDDDLPVAREERPRLGVVEVPEALVERHVHAPGLPALRAAPFAHLVVVKP